MTVNELDEECFKLELPPEDFSRNVILSSGGLAAVLSSLNSSAEVLPRMRNIVHSRYVPCRQCPFPNAEVVDRLCCYC